MSGRTSRRKGAQYERDVAAQLREALPHLADHIRRGIGQARSGSEVPDVDGVPGVWLECKHRKNISAEAALRQAEEATDGRLPVAICKRDHQDAYVVMRLPVFLSLLQLALASQEK